MVLFRLHIVFEQDYCPEIFAKECHLICTCHSIADSVSCLSLDWILQGRQQAAGLTLPFMLMLVAWGDSCQDCDSWVSLWASSLSLKRTFALCTVVCTIHDNIWLSCVQMSLSTVSVVSLYVLQTLVPQNSAAYNKWLFLLACEGGHCGHWMFCLRSAVDAAVSDTKDECEAAVLQSVLDAL